MTRKNKSIKTDIANRSDTLKWNEITVRSVYISYREKNMKKNEWEKWEIRKERKKKTPTEMNKKKKNKRYVVDE